MTKYEFFNKLSEEQKGQFVKELYCWLDMYTDKISNYIFNNKLDEIVNDNMALKLLHELYQHSRIEKDSSISNMLFKFRFPDSNGNTSFRIHERCGLAKASAFRSVLYELYISDMPREEKED